MYIQCHFTKNISIHQIDYIHCDYCYIFKFFTTLYCVKYNAYNSQIIVSIASATIFKTWKSFQCVLEDYEEHLALSHSVFSECVVMNFNVVINALSTKHTLMYIMLLIYRF